MMDKTVSVYVCLYGKSLGTSNAKTIRQHAQTKYKHRIKTQGNSNMLKRQILVVEP